MKTSTKARADQKTSAPPSDPGDDRALPAHQNRLLAALSPDDFALLVADLRPEVLERRKSIEKRNTPIDRLYFPNQGIISVVAVTDRIEVEVGLIGREGVSGIPIVHGDDRSPHTTYVQVSGAGLSIPVEALKKALRKSETLHTLLLKYAQAFLIQTNHTAIANAKAKIEERLARWLLMAHDRVPTNDIPLTHEFLALMLGVRRPGVTDAIHVLQKRKLIHNKKPALVTVIDRIGLEKAAGPYYGVPESEYKRLIG